MTFRLFFMLSVLLFCLTPTFSQQITGKIIDSKTKEPVPFSTIQFDAYNGVVTNMEGYFSFSGEILDTSKKMTVSCLGYIPTFLTLEELKSKNFIVQLDEAINELSTVYITNKLPNVDSIMRRVQLHLKDNYNSALTKNTIFSRQTAYFKPSNVVIDIDKSSGFSKKQLQESNKQLDSLSSIWVNSAPSQEFTDILADFYVYNADDVKLKITKATKLLDVKNKNTFDNMQKKATNVILKHLDIDKTYKLKSGLFKIEDSLSLKDSQKQDTEEKMPELKHIKDNAQGFIVQHEFGGSSLFDFVMDTSIYEYNIQDVNYIDSKPVYIIHFEPRKNKAKYSGNLYVSEQDYAILRVNYKFADGKKGDSFNLRLLLGIKYVENVNTGTVIYKKNLETNYYYPYYINQMIGRYGYVHRPLKFIENGGEKDKIAFDFKVEGDFIEKRELLNFLNASITQTDYNAISENATVEFIKLKQYDPSIWKDYNAIEPLEEMKQFKVKD